MLNRSASLGMSTSVLKMPGILDIKRDSPGFLEGIQRTMPQTPEITPYTMGAISNN